MRFLRVSLSRRLDAAERPAKVVEFPFIRQFLALSHLDEFQDFVDAVNQIAQPFGNLGSVRHRLVDRGSVSGAKIGGLGPSFGRRGLRSALMPMRRRWLGTARRRRFFGQMSRCRAFWSRSGRRHFGCLGSIPLDFWRGDTFGSRIGISGNIPGAR